MVTGRYIKICKFHYNGISKNNNNLYVVKKSKRVKMIYFDKENHDIEETNTATFDHVPKYVCHQRLHRVTNDQKIANDLILQL